MAPGKTPVLRGPALAAGVALAWILTANPSFAASPLSPPPPPPPHPAFITETDEPPWTDCLWGGGGHVSRRCPLHPDARGRRRGRLRARGRLLLRPRHRGLAVSGTRLDPGHHLGRGDDGGPHRPGQPRAVPVVPRARTDASATADHGADDQPVDGPDDIRGSTIAHAWARPSVAPLVGGPADHQGPPAPLRDTESRQVPDAPGVSM